MRTALLALALAGCASAPEYWELMHKPLAKEQVIVLDQMPWPGVEGWVSRVPAKDLCIIYIKRNSNRDCVLEHERRHCAGWNHPNYKFNLKC